jgi:hypothetical protein
MCALTPIDDAIPERELSRITQLVEGYHQAVHVFGVSGNMRFIIEYPPLSLTAFCSIYPPHHYFEANPVHSGRTKLFALIFLYSLPGYDRW